MELGFGYVRVEQQARGRVPLGAVRAPEAGVAHWRRGRLRRDQRVVQRAQEVVGARLHERDQNAPQLVRQTRALHVCQHHQSCQIH